MGKLFGTDGIRGKANQYPMTCEIALKAGRAVGNYCRKHNFGHVIIGKDTRISGDMLESALSAGVTSTGVNVKLAGIIPTPGVAFLCRDIENVGAGIVISASHNPFYDNGIKIFKQGGTKLSDKEEADLESDILEDKIVPRDNIGKVTVISDSLDRYAGFLKSKFPFKKLDTPKKIIVDCSNGAASKIGHLVFAEPLFNTSFIHDNPDGKNINDHCGSQHTDDLKTAVLDQKADIGLAFDGDADRLIVVNENGVEITGDCILAICGRYAQQRGDLAKNTVVTTIMSNIGLTQALDRLGITHIKADVGDRKVLEEMVKTGAVIGGEDSGHMIFLKDHTTGDGILSALKLLEVLVAEKKTISELSEIMTVFPQILMNVDVDASRPDYTKNSSIADAIKAVESALGKAGRVLVRYSGTQPMIRVMVEGPDQETINQHCYRICDTIKNNLK